MPRALDDGIWVFDRSFSVLGIAIGTRMTAVRLADGGLFLHSPVELDDRTHSALEELGPVRFVVAPNRVHHLFVAPYREAWPDAELWAAPGLPEKRRDLPFDYVLSDSESGPWRAEIDQHLFAGIPHMNEVVFLHRASRTLLLTDLAMNFVDADGWLTRLFLRAMGIYRRFGTSRLIRSTLVRDRDAARASLAHILAWDFERVVVTHGVVLQRQGKRQLREALAWLDGD